MRTRAFRRHQAIRHMRRRLSEDRNQHYADLSCPCWSDPKVMARFKEQPKQTQCDCCSSPRYSAKGKEKFTMQERKFLAEPIDALPR